MENMKSDDLQAAKRVVRGLQEALDDARPGESAAALGRHVAPDYLWRGMHPFNERRGAASVAETFWDPLRSAVTSMQRREDIFMAGGNHIDDGQSIWVASMGHLMGLFDTPWLGIAPTRKLVMLRYAEFHKVEAGLVSETALFIDIPHLMIQAGLNPFPQATAQHLVQPGPRTHDGVMDTAQPAEEGAATLAAINAMISDLGRWDLGVPLVEELRRTWHEDMLWWGPAGIGATYTIPRYAEQHSGPFRAGFADRSKTRHIARLAEGAYGGFFGWPNFTARTTGGFMGLPATDRPAEFRVVDIYRRRGEKLAENWVFIDIPHFLMTQGIDLLADLG